MLQSGLTDKRYDKEDSGAYVRCPSWTLLRHRRFTHLWFCTTSAHVGQRNGSSVLVCLRWSCWSETPFERTLGTPGVCSHTLRTTGIERSQVSSGPYSSPSSTALLHTALAKYLDFVWMLPVPVNNCAKWIKIRDIDSCLMESKILNPGIVLCPVILKKCVLINFESLVVSVIEIADGCRCWWHCLSSLNRMIAYNGIGRGLESSRGAVLWSRLGLRMPLRTHIISLRVGTHLLLISFLSLSL